MNIISKSIIAADFEKFYHEIHGIDISLPNELFYGIKDQQHCMVIPVDMDDEKIFANFTKVGFTTSIYKIPGISLKYTQHQDRPNKTYVFSHSGSAEPDLEHLNRTYPDYSTDGYSYMTVREHMLLFQFMYWKYSIALDRMFYTSTASLETGGAHVLYCHSSLGKYSIGFAGLNCVCQKYCPRKIKII